VPVDLALILDHSGSINRDRDWPKALDLASLITYSHNVCKNDTRVALITFSDNAKIEIGFESYTDKNKLTNDKIDKAIQDLQDITSRDKKHKHRLTYIDKALQLANKELFNEKKGMRKISLKVSKSRGSG